MLNSNRIDPKYLEALHQRERNLEDKMKEREKERSRANDTYLEHIRKELDMLVTEKDKLDLRNDQFIKEAGSFTKQFNRLLPQLMETEDRLKEAKIRYLSYLEKNK